jgi:hypothetical protein
MSDKLPSQRSWRRRAALALGVVLLAYLTIAYFLLPVGWLRYTRRHPDFDNVPRITHTVDGIPGDPLNVALVGTETELKGILTAARWHPADPLSLRADLKIAEATVLKRPYDDAPVSNLFLDGRKEDFAFEQPVGDDPRRRHHVRFWKCDARAPDGRPTWIGAGTFDERVGLSHTTGQITHHISADVDAERDHLFATLEQTGQLAESFVVTNFHSQRTGKNGGGDLWHTDGNLRAGIIRTAVESSQ